MTGRRYFGQQQVVDLLSYLRLLQNRYDDEALLTVLASPFVGVSNDALVLIRSTAERRPIFKGIERTLAARPRRGRPAARARVPAALRAPRRELDAALAGAALRADPRRARLRPRRARRAATANAGTRTSASSRGWRARTRSSAGRNIEGFIRFVAEQEAAGAPRARRRLGGGGRRRGAAAHDPRCQGPRVQGRRRRRRGSRAVTNATRSCASRTAASGSRWRIPDTGTRVGHDLVPGRQGDARPRGGGRAAAPLLRRDDARDGAADRLGLGRSLERARRADADRLGAAAASPRRRARPRPVRPARSRSSAVPPASCCGSTASRPPPHGVSADGTLELEVRRRSRAARALRGRRGGRSGCGPAACASSSRFRRRRSPASRASRTARSRSIDRCGYRYYAERVVGHAAGPVGAATGDGVDGGPRIRPRSATPCTGCSSSSICAARGSRRGRARGASSRAWYPTVADDELERIGELVALVHELRRSRRGSRAARRPAGATVRLRARRRARERAARRALARRRAGARARLQDERAPRP